MGLTNSLIALLVYPILKISCLWALFWFLPLWFILWQRIKCALHHARAVQWMRALHYKHVLCWCCGSCPAVADAESRTQAFVLHCIKIITKKNLKKIETVGRFCRRFSANPRIFEAPSDPASGEGGNVQPEAFPGSPGHGFRERPFSSTKSLLQECLRRRALW